MPGEHNDAEKLAVLLGYWIEHNIEHIAENRTWMEKAERAGLGGAAGRLKKVVELSEEVNHHMEHAREDVEEALGEAAHVHPGHPREAQGRGGHAHSTDRSGGHAHATEPRKGHAHAADSAGGNRHVHRHIELHQIGEIKTTLGEAPVPAATGGAGTGSCSIRLYDELPGELERIGGCPRVYVLYRRGGSNKPSGQPGGSGGLPERLGQIGLSAVSVLGVSGGTLRISPVGVPDGTPVLAILPCPESDG